MFRTLVVPLDGSPFAEQALPWALAIARRSGASLGLVRAHVLYALQEPSAAWGPYDPAADAACQRQEQEYLDGTARRLTATARVAIDSAVLQGLPADAILGRVDAGQASL